MKLSLGTSAFIVGILGCLIGILLNLNRLKRKAITNNLEFSYKKAFLEDWLLTTVNFILIFVLLIFLPYRSGKLLEYADYYVLGLFFVVGIMGNVLLLPALSKAYSRLTAGEAYKSAEFDKLTGNEGVPTPAIKPPKS